LGSGILAREEATGRGKFLLTADAKAPGFCRQRPPGRFVRQDRLAIPCDMDVGVTGRQILVRARAGVSAGSARRRYDYSGARGVAIRCRAITLRRAISNLVDNAIKYGTNVAVHLAREPELVMITIDDDGPGIPPSQRDKVFEPFYVKSVPVTPRLAVSD
jgi:signal transduction histidine kinase